ncbi:hypothetical protein [Calothrix sp. NIES-2098]|uniref:hypothetical protein n=1 Tax=Calothrix sp. NIES-2098 TaxID=1954171 RepID=UPI000B61071F|nr:hypothetical protein NIES2098_28560 [Calothrix sp. NIES-2098]
MKLSFIPTAFTLTLTLGITWLNASFSTTAYAVDDGKTEVCEIPQRRPSGGNTLQRMLSMQACEQIQLNQQQKLSTTPIKQSNPASPIALPTPNNQAPGNGVNNSEPSQPTSIQVPMKKE